MSRPLPNINMKFIEYFKDFPDCYVVIGGTAMSIMSSEIGLNTRVTKDYDLVLKEENLSNSFIETLHLFIKNAGYNQYEKKNGVKHNFYRFDKPKDNRYPAMLELFSRSSLDFIMKKNNQTRPMHFVNSESLSALLLNDDYYNMLSVGSEVSDGGIVCLSLPYLIVFKAKAWIDLSTRKDLGQKNVSTHDIKKHINDVFHLVQGLNGAERLFLNLSVQQDMKDFLEKVQEINVDYASNVGSILEKAETIDLLTILFGLEN